MPLRVRWILLGAAWTTAAVALLSHGWYAVVSEYYVNATAVAGVWLGLANDLANGVFYRPLVSDAGYGGTRYFPLFFSLIALFQRLGLPVLTAGYLASAIGAIVLGLGVYRLLATLGVRPGIAVTGALLGLAPHFVQETVFAIRSDVLALGFVTWGLVLVMRAVRSGDGSRRGLGLIAAAILLTLAFSTKPTSAYGLLVAAAALRAHGAGRDALRLIAITLGGYLLVVAVMQAASHGHWLESFRASAFSGDSWPRAAVRAFELLLIIPTASRLLTATFVVAAIAAIVTWRRARTSLPVIWLALAAPATGLILILSGTVLTNHTIDLYVSSVILIASHTMLVRETRRQLAHGLLVAVLVAAAWQNYTRSARLDLPGVAADVPSQRAQWLEAAGGFTGPVFSETAQVPLAAGVTTVVLDSFALRGVTIARPDVLADIQRNLRGRIYTRVLLTDDPLTPHGRGWYTDAHLGWPIVEAILESYRFAGTQAGIRVYVPKVN